MRYLRVVFKAKLGQSIKINFSQPTQVKLFSEVQFKKYRNGGSNTYRGGAFEESPAIFQIPSTGTWAVVVEKGSYYNPIDIEASVELVDALLDASGNLPIPPKEIETPIAEVKEISNETTEENDVDSEEELEPKED